jgi:hypothetical protein
MMFLKNCCDQCSGSGIRCFFTPRIRDPGWSNGRIRDKQTKIVNSLHTKIGRIRDPCFFTLLIRNPDPGWSNGRIRIRDKTSRIRNTGCDLWKFIRFKSCCMSLNVTEPDVFFRVALASIFCTNLRSKLCPFVTSTLKFRLNKFSSCLIY